MTERPAESLAMLAGRVFQPFVGGRARPAEHMLEIKSPYDRRSITTVGLADAAIAEEAVAAAAAAFPAWSAQPAYRRAELLERAASLIDRRQALLSATVTAELGKPIRDSEGELKRSSGILRRAAAEALRFHGDVVQMDGHEGSEDRFGFTFRVPLGPVACIVPFNFPASSVLHKVAPALAVGNTVVVKPASATPVSALLLGELFAEAGFPDGVVNVIPGPSPTVGPVLVGDKRVAMVSFTGSAEAGLEVRRAAGYKRTQLELGGNSAVIVHDDADLDVAASVVARQGTSCAGQVCLAVQRVFVQSAVLDAFLERLVEAFRGLAIGDPFDRATDVGPLVNESEAARVATWIGEATDAGARIRIGGERQGAIVEPTIVTGTRPSMRLVHEELFGPAVTVDGYETFDEAIDRVNESRYGLQAGVFTADLRRAFRAARRIQVGGLIVNDGPRFRIDSMPYGGTKLSGIGREGTRYAMEEMSDIRVVVFDDVFTND